MSEDETFNALKYLRMSYYLSFTSILSVEEEELMALDIRRILAEYNIEFDNNYTFSGYRNQDWSDALHGIKEYRRAHISTSTIAMTPFIISDHND